MLKSFKEILRIGLMKIKMLIQQSHLIVINALNGYFLLFEKFKNVTYIIRGQEWDRILNIKVDLRSLDNSFNKVIIFWTRQLK